MPRNGLNRTRIIAAAAEMIDQSGMENFSMRTLAESLNVKTASLYNHVENMDSLMTDACAYAMKMQWDTEMHAIDGLTGIAAIDALAASYRHFTKEHPHLYRLIVHTAANQDGLTDALKYTVEPFLQVLSDTHLTQSEKVHWQRVLRGIVHGFVSQEEAGFFAHLPEDVETSFQTAIQCYIDGLKQAETRKTI